MESDQPEVACLLSEGDERESSVFFDTKPSAEIPRFAESLFQGADAAAELLPVMIAEDRDTALASI